MTLRFPDHDDAKDPIPPPCPDMRDRERTRWTGEPEQTPAGFVGDVMLYRQSERRSKMKVSNHTQHDGIKRQLANIAICERQLRQSPTGEYAERMKHEIEKSRSWIRQLRDAEVYVDSLYP